MRVLRILVVDDSVVFRSQIKAALNGIEGVEVTNVAANGKIALEWMRQRPVDVVTLDLEMPEMNGVETLSEMKRLNIDAKVIVFSSQTAAGAKKALQALSIGAVDFVTKPNTVPGGMSGVDAIKKQLMPLVRQFSANARTDGAVRVRPSVAPKAPPKWPQVDLSRMRPRVLVIASSTGGPGALENLFRNLPRQLSCPVLIVQHMPPVFTASLAERLGQVSGLDVREAVDGEEVVEGRVYVAPGDFHLSLNRCDDKVFVKLDQRPTRNSVRPAVDFLFESAASIFAKDCLGIVLTGMGEDGRDGAMAIKESGGAVMIQDRDSCVVYGMPAAVFNSGAFDRQSNLEGLAGNLAYLIRKES